MEIKPYIVYVKTDDANRITAINSSAFLRDTDGWTEIDSGMGDKFHHAQGNYLAMPIMDDRGIFRYKLEDGVVRWRSETEMDADYTVPETKPTQEERLAKLESIFTLIAEKLGVTIE